MAYIRKEIPFGESHKKSKRGIYRINDPMMDFYYTFIIPNMSSLGRGRKNMVMEDIEKDLPSYVARHWEHLCREAVSGNKLYGYRWGEASRWWGTVPGNEKGSFQELEFDLIAESTDGKALLVGECKWTNPEITVELHHKLAYKASLLPIARNKKIISVLFLKNTPKDTAANINILYPQDIINAMLPE
jgi:AAA+ ATPase superfamily predicted ATPase